MGSIELEMIERLIKERREADKRATAYVKWGDALQSALIDVSINTEDPTTRVRIDSHLKQANYAFEKAMRGDTDEQ